jgi:MarR family transcriptional regulator, organic hydroperoxide resistance regulator
LELTSEQVSEIVKLENQICFPFYAASRLIVQAYAPFLEKMKITYPQYLVLMVLWEKDAQSVKEIGKTLFLDSGTLTPVMQKLESLEYIGRGRDPQDDRVVLNSLTQKGRQLKGPAAQMGIELFCNSGLSQNEAVELRTRVNGLIEKLTAL